MEDRCVSYRVKVNNVPRSNKCKYIVARIHGGKLWYWGGWYDKTKAEQVAAEVNGVVCEKEDVYE